MKDKYKKMYMRCAEAVAEASEAVRKKVGCVIVDDNGIISEGLNGMPPGWPTEKCEYEVYANSEEGHWWLFDWYKLVTKPECRHAEVAALEKLWAKPNSAKGAMCFVTLSPCLECAIKLKTAGIVKVYYKEKYRDTSGIEYLKENNIEVEQIE